MKKRVLILVPVALLLAVVCLCFVRSVKDNKSDRFAQNVESLSLPPEDYYPDKSARKYDRITSDYIRLYDKNGDWRDSLVSVFHEIECEGRGYMDCKENEDWHDVNTPDVCTLTN